MEAGSEARRLTRIIWSRPARNDIFEIAAYYDEMDADLAEAIVDRIGAASLPLLGHPRLGTPIKNAGIRKWLVRDTPYLPLYAVRGNEIEIRRVRHAASDWQVDE